MAAAAIVAVIHDIIFTVGVYALFHFAVTPATITAFLTILGFSLYDTVVVFDKVRENQRVLTATGRSTYGEMVNKSLNQVLMRSLSTSFVALMPVLSLLIVGSGRVRRDVARGLRARARGRSVHRFVLVDLRRGAAPRVVEGTRAAVPRAGRTARPAGAPALAAASRRDRRRRGRRVRRRPTAASTRAMRRRRRRAARATSARRARTAGGRAHDPAARRASNAAASASSRRSPRPGRRVAGRRGLGSSRIRPVAWMVADTSSLREFVRDIPDWPQPGDRLPRHHAAARGARRVRADRRRAGRARSPTSRSTRCSGSRPGASCSRRRSPTGAAPGSCRSARPGKLPWEIEREEYVLEYGTDLLEIHRDAVHPGEQVLIVDDVIATGGTAAATARLVERLGGTVVGLHVPARAGRARRPGAARRPPSPRGAAV